MTTEDQCGESSLKLHRQLILDLKLGFLDERVGHVQKWKDYIKKYTRGLPKYRYTSIDEDFEFLEQEGYLYVGYYDILIEIFENIDQRAVSRIKKDRKKILSEQSRPGKRGELGPCGGNTKIPRTIVKRSKAETQGTSSTSNVTAGPTKTTPKSPQRKMKCCVLLEWVILCAVALLVVTFLWLYFYQTGTQEGTNTEGTDVHIYSRADWNALPPNGTSPFSKPPIYVLVYHTVTNTCHTFESCVSIVQGVQRFHMFNRGWDDIGYNFLIGQDGSIFEGRGWDKVGAHTRGFNNKGYAIGFIGNFETDIPSADSIHAAKMLIEYGVKQGYISWEYTLYGHRDVSSTRTLSPGKNLYEKIKSWPHYGQSKL